MKQAAAISTPDDSNTLLLYTVRHGDTLSGIIHKLYHLRRGSERYRAAELQLCELNGIKDPNRIRAGQTLNVAPLPEVRIPARSTSSTPKAGPALPPHPPTSIIRSQPAVSPATKSEQDMFWALSWFQENSNWLTIPGGMLADASGRVLHDQNIALLHEVKSLYEAFKAGRLTKGQYDYRRQLALKQFSRRVGPLERLMFGGRTSQEAIRIARAGGIPATQNVLRYASRLTRISKAASRGAPVVLTGASLAAGCMQIAATEDRVEKNEIFVETITSSFVGLALGFMLFSNPIGWTVAIVVVAGSSASSYGAGKLARHFYDKFGKRHDFVSQWKIDSVCQ